MRPSGGSRGPSWLARWYPQGACHTTVLLGPFSEQAGRQTSCACAGIPAPLHGCASLHCRKSWPRDHGQSSPFSVVIPEAFPLTFIPRTVGLRVSVAGRKPLCFQSTAKSNATAIRLPIHPLSVTIPQALERATGLAARASVSPLGLDSSPDRSCVSGLSIVSLPFVFCFYRQLY